MSNVGNHHVMDKKGEVDLTQVNYLAVLITTVITMVLGFFMGFTSMI
ncbi:hypothetical protein [Peribacillus loiseleuriae]|nr:hypothetical protein [Peribacillus loiseleuriae]